ncbi:MAG: hypothetical protein M3Z28_01675 [Candidatus Dormibacteraeota bacterium]|nr:hypothetical protein [Candidatus Dormibacteraeota bacterium]
MRAELIRSGRSVGVSLLAGALAGIVVGGLVARLVFRLIAIAIGPAFAGMMTNDGDAVGDITVQGTIGLILFGGVLHGLIGGGVHAALRPWLTPLGRWRGIGFGVLLVLLLGFTVITPDNPDFRRFGTPAINVALFGGLFILFGALIDRLATELHRASLGASGSEGAGRKALTLLVALSLLVGVFLLVSLLITTVRALIGAVDPGTGIGLTKSLVVLGILAGAVLARVPHDGAWRFVVLAISMVAGVGLTATSIARIIGPAA